MVAEKTTVFVSYSHDDEAHMNWVKQFVTDLRQKGGFRVLYDQDLEKGASLPRFMEQGIRESEKVLVIGTPKYKEKAIASCGVSYEEAIMGTEYMQNIDSTKFYPILRRGSFSTSFPMILAGRNGDDFTDESQYDNNLQIVIQAISGGRSTNAVLDGNILDLCSQSDTFPKLPSHVATIDRDSELQQIEDLLAEDAQPETKVVFVSGQEGVGVTTLLAMLAYRHPSNCISFFNDGFTRYSVNPIVVERSLVKQAYFFINNTPFQDDNGISLSSLYLKILQKTKSAPLYFVFDGFDDVPIEYQPDLVELFDKLPWGTAKFIFSGKKENVEWILPSHKRTILSETANKVLPFSKPRVKDFFSKIDPSLNDGELDELYEITHGLASKINVLRSLYLKNQSFKQILHDKELFSKSIYHAEISKLEESDDELSRILLAVIAFCDIQPSISFIQAVLDKSKSEVEEIIGKNSDFLFIKENGIVMYRSEALYKYMKDYLSDYQSRVEQRFISIYESNASAYADALLPLYKKFNKDQSLIHLLNDDNIQEHLDQNRTQASLNVQCDFGYESALKDPLYLGDALRFAVIRSTSRQIEQNELWDDETEALVLQGRIEEAIALSQNIYLKEERLKSLVIIVKKAKELSQEKKELILLAIRQLSEDIAFEKIPGKSLDLARLLLDVDLQLSMDIIERLLNGEHNNLSPDSIYAMLSLEWGKNYLNDTEITDANNSEKLQSRIQDSETKKMTEAMSLLFSDCTVDEVLTKAQSLNSDMQRVYFLMFWIPGHRTKNGIEKVVLYALNLVVANSNVDIPRINIVQGICKALPYFRSIEDVDKAKQVLDSIESDIKTPTFTFIQVKLLLIEALAKFDQDKAFEQLSNVYVLVDELPDKAILIDCLSLILSAYERLGDKKYMETHLATQNELLNLIKKRLNETFKYTAFHFNLIKNSIKYLVVDYPSFMEDMIPKMNTEGRRSKAYVYGAREYILRCPISKFKWSYFDSLLSNIVFRKDDVVMPLIELARKIRKSDYSDELLTEVRKRQQMFCSIQDDNSKCFVLSQLYIWVHKGNPQESFGDYIAEQMKSCWQSIDSLQTKIEVGYLLVATLSPYNHEMAEDFLNDTLLVKQQAFLSSSSCFEALNDSIDLYTRSVGVMIKAGLCDENVISHFKDEISRLDDIGTRIIAWSKIALEYYLVDDIKNLKKYVYEEVILPLDKLNKNNSYYCSILCSVAPALFLYSEPAFSQYMRGIDEFYVNVCASHACDFIFYKYPYLSDLEYDKNDIRLTYDEYQLLLSLFSYMTFDDELFVKIDNVCKSLREKRYITLSQTHVTYIAKQICELADRKFPAPLGISHDGYKVACHIATHELLHHSSARNLWDVIDTEIQHINNKTDQAFLYFYSLQYISRKPQQLEFLNKGEAILKTINVGFDRFTRFDMALEESLKNCKPQVKDLLNTAMNSVRFETNEEYNFFERFTDIAYQYDDKFADAYLEVSDKDISRRYNRAALKKHVESQKRLKEVDSDFSKSLSLPSNDFSSYFGKVFSSIVRGREIACSPLVLFKLIPSIYSRSLTVSKSAVLYIIEDIRKWHEIHHDQNELIMKVYAAMKFNFRIVEALSVNSKASLERLLAAPTSPSSTVIRPGEKDKGLAFLCDWYKEANTSNLRIIDPYFSAKDLLALRPLFEYNTDLHVSVVAHAKNEDAIENYKEMWYNNIPNLKGCVDIITVRYADKPDDGPLHDRYWFALDRDKEILVGLKTTSISNLGNKDSDSEEIPHGKVKELYEQLWMFYYDRVKQIGEHQLLYQTISF